MDEQQVKDLIAVALKEYTNVHSKTILEDVTAYVENRTSQLEDTLNTIQAPATQDTPDAPENPVDNALTARLALLEKELNETKTARQKQEDESRRLKFSNSIQTAISSIPNVLHGDMLSELMYNRLAEGYTEKDGAFITKNGKTVEEEVKGFIDTEAGKHFLAPKQQSRGSDNPTPATKAAIKTDAARTLTNALLRR